MGQVQEVAETAINVFKLSLTARGRSHSAGPIIEQGTHFCDLSRYFGGEVDTSSVAAHSLEWYEDAGKLSGMVIDENKIEPENRIPRITSATWCVNRPRIFCFFS